MYYYLLPVYSILNMLFNSTFTMLNRYLFGLKPRSSTRVCNSGGFSFLICVGMKSVVEAGLKAGESKAPRIASAAVTPKVNNSVPHTSNFANVEAKSPTLTPTTTPHPLQAEHDAAQRFFNNAKASSSQNSVLNNVPQSEVNPKSVPPIAPPLPSYHLTPKSNSNNIAFTELIKSEGPKDANLKPSEIKGKHSVDNSFENCSSTHSTQISTENSSLLGKVWSYVSGNTSWSNSSQIPVNPLNDSSPVETSSNVSSGLNDVQSQTGSNSQVPITPQHGSSVNDAQSTVVPTDINKNDTSIPINESLQIDDVLPLAIVVPLPPMTPQQGSSVTDAQSKAVPTPPPLPHSVLHSPSFHSNIAFTEKIEVAYLERQERQTIIQDKLMTLDTERSQKSLDLEYKFQLLFERGLLDIEETKAKTNFYNYWIKTHTSGSIEVQNVNENISFKIGLLNILEPTIILSGQQNHPIIICTYKDDHLIVWGYLTSEEKKDTILLTNYQPFSGKDNLQYLKLVEPYIIENKDIQELPVHQKDNAKNYLSKLQDQFGNIYEKKVIPKIKGSLNIYDGTGITLSDIDKVIIAFDKHQDEKALVYFEKYNAKIKQGLPTEDWLNNIKKADKFAYNNLKKLIDENN